MIIESLARESVRRMKPYSSARDEFTGALSREHICADANENWQSLNGGAQPLNRYPDPYQRSLREALSKKLTFPVEGIFIGNGSDEAIELLIEIFCEPGIDEIIITPPTYGMYKVSAEAHGALIKEVPLTDSFEIDRALLTEALTERVKLVFICSPNNPTGNVFNHEVVLSIFKDSNFKGILVVDEAYVDFCPDQSYLRYLASNDRLVILRTFSKAWGLAGARVGMAIANPKIINLFMRKKPPYNVSTLSQEAALNALVLDHLMEQFRDQTLTQRAQLAVSLNTLPGVTVFPSEANFLLVRIPNAPVVYRKLVEQKIIVRNRSNDLWCDNTLRITIGSPEQNKRIFLSMQQILEERV